MERRNKKIAKGKKWNDDRKNKYSNMNVDPDDNYNELSYGDFSKDAIDKRKLEEENKNMQKEDDLIKEEEKEESK